MPRSLLTLLPLLLAAASVATAQGQSYDQRRVGELLSRQGAGPCPDGPIAYEAYTLDHPTGNTVRARHALYERVGEGDVHLGRDRLALTLFLNGIALTDLSVGDTLVLPVHPDAFDLDPLAFAPFPTFWPGAAEIDKAVVIDKDAQAWAAYAQGRLVRWGPASTGAKDTPTPTGRFTMKWRQLDRVSTESPPGEPWRMRYVMNIHAARGIHIHQYDEVPSGLPEGHGCVRLVSADAEWLWDWSDPWTTSRGKGAIGGRLLEEGTLVIVQGEEPEEAPVRFVTGLEGPERFIVTLPEDPLAVPPGEAHH